jgi:hypothetical protein
MANRVHSGFVTRVVFGRAKRPCWRTFKTACHARSVLEDVDRFLRRIWLECCGHMSEFSTGTRHKVSMNTRVSAALGLGERLGYVYDFGSSTSSWSLCWVASTLHLRTPSDSRLAMSRRRGRAMRAGKPRQWCVHNACTRARDSAARCMHQATIAARTCCRR